MSFVIQGIGYGLCALAVAGIAYSLAAAALVARSLRRPRQGDGASPAVTLIKPLHGAPPGLGDALESFCRQDYAGPVQILFGVQDADDDAVPVVRALAARHPGLDIELVVDAAQHGTNRKVSNLVNISRLARHQILVLTDADIVAGSSWLGAVVGALTPEGVGAATCLYVGAPRAGGWSRLAAMAINYQFLSGVALGRAVGLATPCFGSTIALSAQMLEEIGGFEAFADHLADDYEIGRAVRAQGLRVAAPPLTVAHLCTEGSGMELVAHELRWNRTVRQIDPAGYAGSLITHPLALALAGAALLGVSGAAWGPALGLVAAVVATRMAAKAVIDQATGAPVGSYWLLPVRDVLSFGLFAAAFAVNTVHWQGRRFRVGPDGGLIHA